MKFSIIGGDLRLVNLTKLLADDKKELYVFGMEKSEEIENDKRIIKCDTIDSAINKSEVIIGSIPFLKNDEEMYATYSDKTIKLNDLLEKSANSGKTANSSHVKLKNKIFIAGNIPVSAKEKLEQNYGIVIDIMKKEELVVLNTIATAEGAIQVAIQNTDIILQGCNVLILGFGRVAKMVAKKFDGLSSNVTCAARKNVDLAWIKALGYEAKNINELGNDLKKYDIIINTVPQMIIDKEEMQYMKKNILLIDLASYPGGINTEDAQKIGLKFVWALALPGKVAPVTSALFIKETIYNVLNL